MSSNVQCFVADVVFQVPAFAGIKRVYGRLNCEITLSTEHNLSDFEQKVRYTSTLTFIFTLYIG
jgi:hypothetical protein